MTLTERVVGDVVIVDVVGNIVASDAHPLLRDRIAGLTDRGFTRVILNLAGVSYIDSAGLGDLIHAYGVIRKADGVLRLLGVTTRLLHVLTITRLAAFFEMYDDEALALASLGPGAAWSPNGPGLAPPLP